jgi:hypothetical protein
MALECFERSKSNKEFRSIGFGIVALEIAYGEQTIEDVIQNGKSRFRIRLVIEFGSNI